jgi:hypothetical protein
MTCWRFIPPLTRDNPFPPQDATDAGRRAKHWRRSVARTSPLAYTDRKRAGTPSAAATLIIYKNSSKKLDIYSPSWYCVLCSTQLKEE